MMRKVLLILFVFICNNVMAQLNPTQLIFRSDSSWLPASSMLVFQGSMSYRSNAIRNEMINRFIIGGEIDDALINKTSDDLIGMNRLGINAASSLSYYNFADTLLGSSKWGLFLNLEQRFDIHSTFSKDLFNIAFKGNEEYAGKSAYFDGSAFEYLQYQKIGVGFFNKKNFSNLALSYVNGQNMVSTQVDESRLFTSASGDSLYMQYNGSVLVSDTTKNTFFSGAGTGAAIDLNWNIALRDEDAFLMLKIHNLGFIHWNDQTVNYVADSSISYTGVNIGNLYDPENFIEVPSPRDSLQYTESLKENWMSLPARFEIALAQKTTNGNLVEFGIAEMNRQNFAPEFSLAYHILPDGPWMFTAKTRYGGYGGFRAGIAAEFYAASAWYVKLELDDLLGGFLPQGKGRALRLGIARFF